MKKIYFFASFLFVVAIMGTTNAQTVSTFENLGLPVDTFWNGSDQSGGFIDGSARFYNSYDTAYYSWSGFAYSSKKDKLTPGYGNMYSSASGEGSKKSATYGVAYVSSFGAPTAISLTSQARGKMISGFSINNNTYAYLSMLDGDLYTKKFTSHDSDWFMLRTYGYLNGMLQDSVDFYLADFRFADSSKAYIVSDWKWVDLKSLGNVDSLTFAMGSSDVGTWGMNTPAYFCMDDFTTLEGVGFGEVNSSLNIKLYPNPVQSILNIEIEENQVQEVHIYDMSGRMIISENNSRSINVNMLKPGVYHIQIHTEQGLLSKRFIKE